MKLSSIFGPSAQTLALRERAKQLEASVAIFRDRAKRAEQAFSNVNAEKVELQKTLADIRRLYDNTRAHVEKLVAEHVADARTIERLTGERDELARQLSVSKNDQSSFDILKNIADGGKSESRHPKLKNATPVKGEETANSGISDAEMEQMLRQLLGDDEPELTRQISASKLDQGSKAKKKGGPMFSPEQVRSIRCEYTELVNRMNCDAIWAVVQARAALAKKYGCSTTTIYNVVNRFDAYSDTNMARRKAAV